MVLLRHMKISNNTINIHISNRSILRVLVVVAIVAALIKLTDLVLVVLTSIVIASFVRTAADKFADYKIPKTVSVLAMYVLGFLALSGIFYFFVPVLIVELSKLIPLVADLLPGSVDFNAISGARDVAETIAGGGVFTDVLSSLRSTLTSVSGGFVAVITSLFGNIANVVLIIVISFYLSLADDGIETFLKIITPKKHEEYVIDLWHRSRRKIAYWLRGQMLLGLIIGLITFIGLALIGIEYALLLAVITAVFELIPFGMILAAIPAISLGLASGGVPLGIITAALYFVIQQLENYIFQPLIVRRVTGISPIAVILSVLIGFQLAGFWGLVLAIPVAVTLLEYIRDLERNKVKGLEEHGKQK
jgi:predicted PurR-regulated permease PerM